MTRPLRTSPAASRTCAAPIRFGAPASSSGPHRPQASCATPYPPAATSCTAAAFSSLRISLPVTVVGNTSTISKRSGTL